METVQYARETEYQSLRGLMRSSESGDATARLVQLALREELTARQSEMVRMYYLEQMTMIEIAAQLGICTSTVSRTLAAARGKLRRCLRYAKELRRGE